MNSSFAFIYAIIKFVPAVNAMVDKFISWYVSAAIEKMKEADREAIRKAVYERDQRSLESQIGSRRSGEVSNLPGTSVVDSLPNVVPKPEP